MNKKVEVAAELAFSVIPKEIEISQIPSHFTGIERERERERERLKRFIQLLKKMDKVIFIITNLETRHYPYI